MRIRLGFTLIELLVTVGIMAIVGVAILIALNPSDKINSASDARVQANIGELATALVTYSTSHGGSFPCKTAAGGCPNDIGAGDGLQDLVNSGELKQLPVLPTGYTGSFASYEDGYFVNAIGGTPTHFKLVAEVKSARNLGSGGRWVFCSWTGGPALATLSVSLNATVCP